MQRAFVGRSSLFACVLLLGALGSAHGQTFDHLKCYRIRDSVVANYAVQMTDQFGEENCKRNQGRYLCTAAEKTAVVPSPPGGGPSGTSAGNFLCYETHCRNFPPDTLVDDQFGMRTVRFGRTQLMCAPATINPSTATTVPPSTTLTLPPSTTVTTSSSTTTSTSMPQCTDTDVCANGACPPGMRCVTVEPFGCGCRAL